MAQSTNIRDYLEVRDRTSAKNQDIGTHNVMRLNRRLIQRKLKVLWKPSIEHPLRFLGISFVRIHSLINKIQSLRLSAVAIQNHLGRRITLCVVIEVRIYRWLTKDYLSAIDRTSTVIQGFTMTHNIMRPTRRPNIFWRLSCSSGLMAQSTKPMDF